MAIKIWWENAGFNEIMQGDKISTMEEEIMQQKLGEVEAAFFQEFGTEGKFELEKSIGKPSPKHAGRVSWSIKPANAKTTTILKRNSGWLGQFLN